MPGDENSCEQLAAHVPVGRLGRPEVVAEMVHALVTNPFVTSQTVSVDGGMHPANPFNNIAYKPAARRDG